MHPPDFLRTEIKEIKRNQGEIRGHNTDSSLAFVSVFSWHTSMARISRIVVPGFPHHVTQRGVRPMEVFHRDEERRACLRFFAEEAGRFGVDILCWCLMTNHVHVIAVPHQETSLAREFGEAHRRYTRLKNFAEGVRG